MSQPSILWGHAVTATVKFGPVTGRAVALTLAKSSANLEIYPAAVALTPGQTSASFEVECSAPGTYEITATAFGYVAAVAQYSCFDILRVTLSTKLTVLGTSIAGTVSTGAAAPAGGRPVSISTTFPAVISPTPLSIPAGQTSAQFTLTPSAVGVITVTASSAPLCQPASAQVTAYVTTTSSSLPNVEYLGAVNAAQAINGLGFNIDPQNEWEFQMAAAAGATHARFQCSWTTTENQTAPPADSDQTPPFTLQTACKEGLAYSKAAGLKPTILAAYGAPYHQILTVTVPAGADQSATSIDVQFVSGVGGDTFANLRPFYDTILGPQNAYITYTHTYSGGLIGGVTLTDPTHATLNLVSAVSATLPAGPAQYSIYEYLYPPAATTGVNDPSVLAYVRYVNYLASAISLSGNTGEVEVWNEPPWAHDMWDVRSNLYSPWPGSSNPGPTTAGMPNFGFAAALQAQSSTPSGVTFNWGGTHKSGFNSLLDARMAANSGAAYRPGSNISSESFHLYGNNPEDKLWSRPCLEGQPADFSSGWMFCSLEGNGANFSYAAQQSIVANGIEPGSGIGHSVTETGINTADQAHKTRFVMRQYLGFQAANVSPVQFFMFYDPTGNYGFVASSSAHTPLPAYTALAGFIADLNTAGSALTESIDSTLLSSVVGYQGTYPLDVAHFVGTQQGYAAVSDLMTLWQRSNTASNWVNLASPSPGTVTIQIAKGMVAVTAVNLDTRQPVSYQVAGATLTIQVSDDPIEILFQPAS